MAGLKKRAAKRLKISTGDDRAGGATAKYASEMRRAERMAAAKGKSEEEKQLEEQLFGSRHAQPGEEGGEGDYDGVDAQDTLDWLGQKRKNKLRHQGEGQEAAASDNNDGEEEEDLDELDTGLSGVADDQVRVRGAAPRQTAIHCWSASLKIVILTCTLITRFPAILHRCTGTFEPRTSR